MASPKRRMLGMLGGSVWLVAIGAAFTILALWMIGTPVAQFALAGGAIAAVIYLAIGVGMIRAVLRSPGAIPPRTAEDRVMLRRFIQVGIAEVVAIMVANAVVSITQHVDLIAPLDLLIVGIHFLPLASVFRVPRYYVTGSLFCAVSVLTLALVPAHARVGAAAAWFVVPTFGCTFVAWATAAFNLREVSRQVDTA